MPLLLDTDIGTDMDDAWALALLLSDPTADVCGITVTDGDTPARAKLACKLAHRAGRPEVPVAVGRPTPLSTTRRSLQLSWAEDFTTTRPISTPAARFIVDMVDRYPGEVTLLAIGPLQNVADALRLEPDLGSRLKRFVLMNGNVRYSARESFPIVEWNNFRAIEDARLVYQSGLNPFVVPLDATTYVRLGESDRVQLTGPTEPLLESLEILYRLWLPGPVPLNLHDPLAVGEALYPGRFFRLREETTLCLDEEGYTRIDPVRGKPVTVCLQPYREDFVGYFLSTLHG